MSTLSEEIKSADWKNEKHVPVIECSDRVAADEFFDVTVTLGKAIAHPNTTEHHIRYITLSYKADGEPAVYELGHFEFSAHGESAAGANEGPACTQHQATAAVKLKKSGTLYAVAYCNIHGLWQSSKSIAVG